MSHSVGIHLVSYATPQFRPRQVILGLSARLNRVVDTVSNWSPERLKIAGFEGRCPDIQLNERGSGFWAWKPFVIQKRMTEIPDGDIVLYCDVGRRYPFILLDQPIDPFLRWMEEHHQDVMPGVEIPWDGRMSLWTKRDAFVWTGMDRPAAHNAVPIQASFSVWRAGSASRELLEEWMKLCFQRPLISDDPSAFGLPDLPEFVEHRHDQSLLTLCCLKEGLRGLSMGSKRLIVDSRNPSAVSEVAFGRQNCCPTKAGRLLRIAVWPVEKLEPSLRRTLNFGFMKFLD